MSKNSPQPQPLLSKGPPGLPQYAYHPVFYQTIAIPGRVEQVRYRRSPLRRFILGARRHGRHRGWDLPANMVFDRCERASSWAAADSVLLSESAGAFRHAAEATFEIPLTVDTVLVLSVAPQQAVLFSYGTPLSGQLDISTSSRRNNTARVVITSLFGGHKRAAVKACLMSGTDGEAGVGILTGRGFWAAAAVMKIQLVLPEGKTPLHLKGLSVNLPHFTVDVGHLKDAVAFESAVLRTSNAAGSLTASTLTLETSNGGISGTFNTSTHLHLSTSNAPINVSVGLTNANSTAATTLNMRTSNNRLDEAVTLATDGRFRVDGNTSNGVLALGVAGPAGAALSLGARTSNKRAEVALPDAFEGQFTVTTSQHAEDGRTVEYGRVHEGRTVNGWVYAEEAKRRRGSVLVTTSNAEAVLVV
ncbi:hypothetical protein B0H17DRAFT_1051273 [Mycena rosella]|uniref:DUF7330 domain-containing protein n=1 Tax=Mycena rosella TaxID=1033263 RepID=A0AAD7DS53_MYCRO|nr:hypothetical protein B0H17DRAFT_1051273 [Mycena rosella]